MTLRIAGEKEAEDVIRLEKGTTWVDVLINDEIVAVFFSDGESHLVNQGGNTQHCGRWKK